MQPNALFILAFSFAALILSPSLGHAEGMSAVDAYQRAKVGEITLIDVRSPTEWRQTGLPAHGEAITIHDPEGLPAFVRKIGALLGNDRSRPVALICAGGARSGYARQLLNQAGYTKVYNVSEGMTGGRAGPGWLERELPTQAAE